MKNYGELIISGGEAFNANVKKEHRRVTPDLDTKFIPFYRHYNGSEERSGAVTF